MHPWHACGLLAFPDVETEREHQVQAVLLEGVFESSLQTPAQRPTSLPFIRGKLLSAFVIFGSVRRGRRQRKGEDVFYIGQELPASPNTEIMREFHPPHHWPWLGHFISSPAAKIQLQAHMLPRSGDSELINRFSKGKEF